MSFKLADHAAKAKVGNGTAKLVLICLCEQIDDRLPPPYIAVVSRDKLAEMANASSKTVCRSIAYLNTHKFIALHAGGGRGVESTAEILSDLGTGFAAEVGGALSLRAYTPSETGTERSQFVVETRTDGSQFMAHTETDGSQFSPSETGTERSQYRDPRSQFTTPLIGSRVRSLTPESESTPLRSVDSAQRESDARVARPEPEADSLSSSDRQRADQSPDSFQAELDAEDERLARLDAEAVATVNDRRKARDRVDAMFAELCATLRDRNKVCSEKVVKYQALWRQRVEEYGMEDARSAVRGGKRIDLGVFPFDRDGLDGALSPAGFAALVTAGRNGNGTARTQPSMSPEELERYRNSLFEADRQLMAERARQDA